MRIIYKRVFSSVLLFLLSAALCGAEAPGREQQSHGGGATKAKVSGVPGGRGLSHEQTAGEQAFAASGALQRFLGLTDAQLASIDQETRSFEQTLDSLQLRLIQSRAQTEQSMQSGDPASIGKSVLEGVAISKQIRAERNAYQDRVKAILNAQQAEKLNQALEVLRFWREDPAFLGFLETGAGEGEQIRHPAARMERRRHPAPVQ